MKELRAIFNSFINMHFIYLPGYLIIIGTAISSFKSSINQDLLFGIALAIISVHAFVRLFILRNWLAGFAAILLIADMVIIVMSTSVIGQPTTIEIFNYNKLLRSFLGWMSLVAVLLAFHTERIFKRKTLYIK